MLKYLNDTRRYKLVILEENLHAINWYVDAYFGVHTYFKSHTGGVITLGGGSIQYITHKKKMNNQSSTKAEGISSDYAYTIILWMLLFLGYQV